MFQNLFGTRKIGVDLGTTSVLVFVPGKGVILSEPSIVVVSDNKILAVGDEAKQMIGRMPDHIHAYRPMKDGVIADYRVTEAMIRYFLQKTLGKWHIMRPDVLVSVPSGISSTEKRAVIEATVNAGARNAFVIKEPILAAMGAGLPVYEARGHLIVDIGGGTTDSAIISFGSIVTATSVRCAGNHIDTTIIDYVKRVYNLAIGDRTAEEVKIGIGSALPVEEELSMDVKGRDIMTGLPRTITLKTNEIVRAIHKELRDIANAVKSVFQDAPPELAADVIDNGIILTGGASQLRNLGEFIRRRTGVRAELADNAQFCVAKGTGIALEHLDTYKRELLRKR